MRVKGVIRGLQHVATFLNMTGPRMTQTKWPVFFKKFCKQMGLINFRMTFVEANMLRRQLHHDLAFLGWRNIELVSKWSDAADEAKDRRAWTDDERAFFRAEAPLDRPFDALVERLNDLKLAMAWHCEPLASTARPHDPSQAILEITWKNGTTGRWTIRSWMGTGSLTDHLYAILGKALENGMLRRLKVCRECQKYMVVKDLKREFCRTRCHDDFHNRVTHPGNRKHRRGRDILQAKRLLQAGKSIGEIRDETGLPQRVVEQIRSGDLSPNSQQRPKTVTQAKRQTSEQGVVETPEAIAARLRPVIADYYKRMAKLDQKKRSRRPTRPQMKKR